MTGNIRKSRDYNEHESKITFVICISFSIEVSSGCKTFASLKSDNAFLSHRILVLVYEQQKLSRKKLFFNLLVIIQSSIC